jgi:hypothetical protein
MGRWAVGVRSAKELTVYCKAYELAMYTFEVRPVAVRK